MRQFGGTGTCAMVLLAFIVAAPRAVAQSPTRTLSPPPKQTPAAPADDVPPFLHARSWGGEHLNLAISGLKSGLARVEAGDRTFGVCWNGGVEPYEVTLRNATGEALVDESKIDGDELIRSSRPVSFTPGVYTLDVADSAGERATGQFTVIEASSWPGEKPRLADPRTGAITEAHLKYSYDAYLNALAQDGGRWTVAATEHAAQICHRSH
jgi:hypothetical protein